MPNSVERALGMPDVKGPRLRLAALLIAIGIAAPTTISAQIVMDGSLGKAGALSGPAFQITPDLGRQAGGNLFHSFQQFSLPTGASATFSGPSTVANVIARVTGGSSSSIDGAINSTIPNASLFLVNPAGIAFGPHASINIPGSFHATSADYLGFADGTRFLATTANGSTLTAAAPASFGFLSPRSAPVSVNGSMLSGASGTALSLVGGTVTADSAAITVPGGSLSLVSLGGPGEYGLGATSLATAVAGGAVAITGGTTVGAGDASGRVPAGSIRLVGDSITVRSSGITSLNAAAAAGGAILVDGRSAIRLDGAVLSTGSTAQSRGSSGDIRVSGGSFSLDNGAQLGSSTAGSGAAGTIVIQAGSLSVTSRSSIFSSTAASGAAGPVSVTAGTISIVGADNSSIFTQIASSALSGSTGPAGPVTVNAGSLSIVSAGGIASGTFGPGAAGAISVTADTIVIDARGQGTFFTAIAFAPGIASRANFFSTGPAGSVTVRARSVTIANQGQITSDTLGSGAAGTISVTADRIMIDGGGPRPLLTGITSAADLGSTGPAGSVTVQAGSLSLVDGATITSSTFGTGAAGSVSVTAESIVIGGGTKGGGSSISSEASRGSTGRAGSINVQAARLLLLDFGTIASDTFGPGTAGTISVTADRLEIDGGGITTQTNSGSSGSAGSVTVNAGSLSLTNGGFINSNTFGPGAAGTVSVTADTLAIDGPFTAIATEANPGSTGPAGSVGVTAGSLSITNAATIASTTFGPGAAGKISVTADTLSIDGGGEFAFGVTGITTQANPGPTGAAGSITVRARNISIVNLGEIASDTFGPSAAGTVAVTADKISIDGGSNPFFTGISSAAANDATGPAGSVIVQAGSLSILHAGQVSTGAPLGGGGDIVITASRLVYLNRGSITTSVTGGTGSGGNITIDPPSVVLNHGTILAQAVKGRGGNISITADQFLTTGDSVISASSEESVSGQIAINATQVGGSAVAVIPGGAFAANTVQLSERCGFRGAEQRSSLVRAGRGALPADPETALPSTRFARSDEISGPSGIARPMAPAATQSATAVPSCW